MVPPGRAVSARRGYSVRSLGGVAERSNAAVSKTVSGGFVRRGFKSLPLRFSPPKPTRSSRSATRAESVSAHELAARAPALRTRPLVVPRRAPCRDSPTDDRTERRPNHEETWKADRLAELAHRAALSTVALCVAEDEPLDGEPRHAGRDEHQHGDERKHERAAHERRSSPRPAGRSAAYRSCAARATPALAGATRRKAERAGFEPATHLSARTRFPVALLRPLGHLSGREAG